MCCLQLLLFFKKKEQTNKKPEEKNKQVDQNKTKQGAENHEQECTTLPIWVLLSQFPPN